MQSSMESVQENACVPNEAVSDRRKEPRYAAEVQDARIGWWRNRQFLTAEATLHDISSGGAALAIDPEVRAAPQMWFCVASAGGAVWVPGRVAELTSTDEGVQRVCLEFSHACPYDVFKVAAWGSSTGPSQDVGQDAKRPAGAESLVTTVSSTAITPSPGQSTACRISSTPVEDVDLDDFESAPAPANPPATSLCGLGSAPERRSAVMIALDWLVPATLCLSMALAIICITYVVLSDPALLDPLLSSLRGE